MFGKYFGVSILATALMDFNLTQAQFSVAPDFSKLDKFADRLSFDYEIIDVTTEDGFILSLIHILNKKGEPYKKGKKPMLFQHSLLDDGLTWMAVQYVNDHPVL